MAETGGTGDGGRTAWLLEQAWRSHDGTAADKARLTGFHERKLRRWRAEGWRTIPVGDADRILDALGSGDAMAHCLTAAGFHSYVGKGPHAFLQGMLEETLPVIIDAERCGVPILRQHGINAGRAVSIKVRAAIEHAEQVIASDLTRR